MWNELFSRLPFEIVNHLKMVSEEITEIRIRRDAPLCITVLKKNANGMCYENRELALTVHSALMDTVIRALTDNALYAHENTIKEGYITVQGCYRVGIIGKSVLDANGFMRLSLVRSLNIRLWRECDGIADKIYERIKCGEFRQSVLIVSPPSGGKTTVLRDLTRSLVQKHPHKRVALIDTRSEIATPRMLQLPHLDVLTNYPKIKGIEIAVRVLSPEYIVCDEIGLVDEASLLEIVQSCGVPCIMSAHSDSVKSLLRQSSFFHLYQNHFFDLYAQIDGILDTGKMEFSIYPKECIRL